jgi:pyruvate dehydrogenase E1 component
LIAAHAGRRYLALGTDGFGRSDARAALREFFEMDRRHIAVAAIAELVRGGRLDARIQQAAITRYEVNAERAAPWTM